VEGGDWERDRKTGKHSGGGWLEEAATNRGQKAVFIGGSGLGYECRRYLKNQKENCQC